MYRKMYLLLFNRISDAIRAIERGDAAQARSVLIRAQREAEAMYIEATEE